MTHVNAAKLSKEQSLIHKTFLPRLLLPMGLISTGLCLLKCSASIKSQPRLSFDIICGIVTIERKHKGHEAAENLQHAKMQSTIGNGVD